MGAWARGLVVAILCATSVRAQDVWTSARRGSAVVAGDPRPGDLVLVADAARPAVLVIGAAEPENVRRAAGFLADDIERITGVRPVWLGEPSADRPCIDIRTIPDASRFECYDLAILPDRVEIRGSDPRGTAFGIADLCERIGVDPLHHFTGLAPARRIPLVLKPLRVSEGPPVFRYRGLFHDDEDILPMPRTPEGIPDRHGTVPAIWYERFFETAVRLRMNMVAPWVRVQRPPAVPELANSYGLLYTSHHYDTLLSDPYHFERGGLAARRGVRPEWDWTTNREGLIRYWKGGVEENSGFSCIWPVGMRGTNDYAYRFPRDWTEDRRLEAYREAIEIQVGLVDGALPPERDRLFHFTMYTEMLPYFQTGRLPVPESVILVWPDDNNGRMRALPAAPGRHRHGIYYHLAYLGGAKTAQAHQVISPDLIESEFRTVVERGATAFCLVNVSELREYVLGIRLIADIQWHAAAAFAVPEAGRRFLGTWCRESFGSAAEADAVKAYIAFFDLVGEARWLAHGASKCTGALRSLESKFAGRPFAPALPDTLPVLRERHARQVLLLALLERARAKIAEPAAGRFFFENLELAAAIDRLNTEAALHLVTAMAEPDRDAALDLCRRALVPLDELDLLLRRAERPPFDGWYGPTWITQRNDVLVTPRRALTVLLAGLKPSPPGPR